MNSLNSTIGTFAEPFENSSWVFIKTVSSHFQIFLIVDVGVCPKKGSKLMKRLEHKSYEEGLRGAGVV